MRWEAGFDAPFASLLTNAFLTTHCGDEGLAEYCDRGAEGPFAPAVEDRAICCEAAVQREAEIDCGLLGLGEEGSALYLRAAAEGLACLHPVVSANCARISFAGRALADIVRVPRVNPSQSNAFYALLSCFCTPACASAPYRSAMSPSADQFVLPSLRASARPAPPLSLLNLVHCCPLQLLHLSRRPCAPSPL